MEVGLILNDVIVVFVFVWSDKSYFAVETYHVWAYARQKSQIVRSYKVYEFSSRRESKKFTYGSVYHIST